MKDIDIEERANRATRNFEAGYNCAQSVFLAYSDVFDLDMETAKKISVSFGGGVGRMREICGTVSAMAMLAGFKYPVLDITDQEARTRNYAMVQKIYLRKSTGRSSVASFCRLKTQQPQHRHPPPVHKNIIRSGPVEDLLKIRPALQGKC